jgi:tetratricopeptide (TPR) repeat protein
MAVQMWRPDAQRALRAALLAVDGGDAASALQLVAEAETRIGARDGPRTVLSTRLRAYAMLGRGAEAQKAFGAVQAELSPVERDAARRAVAWAWVRSGRVAEAREALGGATADPDAELSGWLALYDGDLAGARRGLRRADARTGDAALALAFVTRTKQTRAPLSGAAFLTLARGDTAAAELAFARAAAEVPDASSVLLLTSARLYSQQHREPDAIAIWKQLVDAQAATPEAAEAELEWAKVLRAHGERTAAISHLEHLILSWPDSALLPQARRELELAKGSIPGTRPYA